MNTCQRQKGRLDESFIYSSQAVIDSTKLMTYDVKCESFR